MTRQDEQVDAGAIGEDGTWLDRLQGELRGLLAPVFAQARSRLAAFAYVGALLAEPGDRWSCWQLAERAGHATLRRMQALLAEHAWDWKQAPAALQRFILARLGDPGAIMVLDETRGAEEGRPDGGRGPASMPGSPGRWRTARLWCSPPTSPPAPIPCSTAGFTCRNSVPEARRLLRLATTPMSRTAHDLGYAWSRWRRRHQARARWHHYHARLKAVRVT